MKRAENRCALRVLARAVQPLASRAEGWENGAVIGAIAGELFTLRRPDLVWVADEDSVEALGFTSTSREIVFPSETLRSAIEPRGSVVEIFGAFADVR